MAKSRQEWKRDKRTLQRTDNRCPLELVRDEKLLAARFATWEIRYPRDQAAIEFEKLERARRPGR